jgi:hypothetical protein
VQDTRQVIKAFEQASSAQSQYGKGKGGNTFYMALEVTSNRPDIRQDKCVDAGFFAWIRKFFTAQAAQITLTASITGPGETPGDAKTVPLFQISHDEKTSPPSCFTELIPNRIITQYYLADALHPFRVDAEIRTQRAANVSGGQSLLSEASESLSFTGYNGTLANLSAAQLITGAAKRLDSSLATNWSQTRQEKYHFDISAWPDNGDWDHHVDQARFAVANLIATSTGIHVQATLIPALTIRPSFRLSMFGDGPGAYDLPDRVMVQKLVSANMGDLSSILRNGIKGFTTDQAMSISEPSAMESFCKQMRGLFPVFLTDDDALAARYAVLKSTTNFMRVAKLQQSTNCIEPDEVKRLFLLSSAYVVDDLNRIAGGDRSGFVSHRISALARPLSVGSKEDLLQVIDDVAKFRVDVSAEARSIFPARKDGKAWGGIVGQSAVDQLVEAGGFRLGCGHAATGQILRNIAAVAMDKRTNKSAAVFIEFANPDPDPSADPAQEKPKIKRLSFYLVSQLQDVLTLPGWPDESCPLR